MCSQGCETITITHTHQTVAPIPSPPQLLAIITPFPVSVSPTIQGSRSTRYFSFGARPFHLSCVFKVHPCHSVFQDSWYSMYVPHSSSHMALRWFCVSIVSDAAVHTCTRTCFWRFGIYPDIGCWTCDCVDCCDCSFHFWGATVLFPQQPSLFRFPPSVYVVFQLSHLSQKLPVYGFLLFVLLSFENVLAILMSVRLFF